jgi:hypothetical protein
VKGGKDLQHSNMSDYMPRLIKHFYGDELVQSLCNVDTTISPSARSHCHNIDSTIILSVEEENITECLASPGKISKPKLLYCASRDGWDASDFHRMCEAKNTNTSTE